MHTLIPVFPEPGFGSFLPPPRSAISLRVGTHLPATTLPQRIEHSSTTQRFATPQPISKFAPSVEESRVSLLPRDECVPEPILDVSRAFTTSQNYAFQPRLHPKDWPIIHSVIAQVIEDPTSIVHRLLLLPPGLLSGINTEKPPYILTHHPHIIYLRQC
ncbi:hypothetical protein LshimejAT787_0201190 [Lyophyllum shimeji]|uniref:Uncharacterized protein n=1 Tax=Lyophyllum shimeji TaxID=47721 RepID=A0A9P3UHV9_LYOSH|nr:hypothetical protein LshimejAT787_0201190 [Lyophyllum shimeji]